MYQHGCTPVIFAVTYSTTGYFLLHITLPYYLFRHQRNLIRKGLLKLDKTEFNQCLSGFALVSQLALFEFDASKVAHIMA